MANQIMCPTAVSPIYQGCMTKELLDHIYDLCDQAKDRINLIKSGIMGEQPLASVVRQEAGCITSNTFIDIKEWMAAAVATGYVKKYAEYGDGTPVPFPTSRSDVEFLKTCEAFWNNIYEIYGCMGISAPVRDCLQPKLLAALVGVLECMINEKCSPCMCPVCQGGDCNACDKCITLLIEYFDVTCYAVLNYDHLRSTDCLLYFNFHELQTRDANTHALMSPKIWFSGTLYLVKGCGYIYLKYGDERDPDFNNWWYAENIVAYQCGDGTNPSDLCTEWMKDNTVNPVFSDLTFEIYRYMMNEGLGLTIPEGEVTVSAYSNMPICHKPWTGLAPHYRITMGDIPECEACDVHHGFPCEGLMSFDDVNGMFVLDGSETNSWHDRDFHAEIQFDGGRCTYLLVLWCWHTNPGSEEIPDPEPIKMTMFRGVKTGCGGPEGLYTPDPDFQTPCFIGTVRVTVEPETPPI